MPNQRPHTALAACLIATCVVFALILSLFLATHVAFGRTPDTLPPNDIPLICVEALTGYAQNVGGQQTEKYQAAYNGCVKNFLARWNIDVSEWYLASQAVKDYCWDTRGENPSPRWPSGTAASCAQCIRLNQCRLP